MAQFPGDMSHDFLSLRRRADSDPVPDYGRELDRRRRPLGDGSRPAVDPLRARARAFAAAAGTETIGRAVWESAARARRLGETVVLVHDDQNDGRSSDTAGHAMVSAWLAGLSLWAIVLFLLGLE